MNKHELKKSEGKHVRLRPVAKRLGGGGTGPESVPIDDDWKIVTLDETGLHISNTRTNHGIVLGLDHIHHFTSDPQRGSAYGFLTLNGQISIYGNDASFDPTICQGNLK